MTENKIAIQHQASNNKTYQNQTLPSESKLKDPHVSNSLQERKMNLAASWYIAMPSKALKKDLKEIELFGKSLMAWRDSQGTPIIMERYCAHLGANLAVGKIVDGCVQCPFHHWQYDRTGQCVHIPDVNHIPSHARQTTYNIIEKYGYIWIWYGSKQPLFPLPEFVPAGDWRQDYMFWRLEFKTKTTSRQILENMYDYYHLVAVHGMRLNGTVKFTMLDSSKESQLPIAREAWLGALIETPIKGYNGLIGMIAGYLGLKAETFASRLDSCASINLVTGIVNGKERFRVLDAMTPVNANETIWHALLSVKKSGKLWLDILNYFTLGMQSKVSAIQDVKIFDTLGKNEKKLYILHDQGILKYRKFYQSWVDKVELD